MTPEAQNWNIDRLAGRSGWRRFLLLILVLGTSAVGAVLAAEVISARGPAALRFIFLPVFVKMARVEAMTPDSLTEVPSSSSASSPQE